MKLYAKDIPYYINLKFTTFNLLKISLAYMHLKKKKKRAHYL
jgi:hypothetical protein